MKILITGAGGMLGTDCVNRFKKGHDLHGSGLMPAEHLAIPYDVVDCTQQSALQKFFNKVKPDAVLHLAAMTDVDGCETRRDEAHLNNVVATSNIADCANDAGAFLIHISTDYVFDGTKPGEYEENDIPSPVSYYGQTKLEGERYLISHSQRFAIFRLSWLYGLHGKSFPRTIRDLAKKNPVLKIVEDQKGRPTYTRDVADALGKVLDENRLAAMQGQIYHLANQGSCTWAGFARKVVDSSGLAHVQIQPISSEDLNRPAKRPANSIFALEKVKRDLGISLRPWQDAVEAFLTELS